MLRSTSPKLDLLIAGFTSGGLLQMLREAHGLGFAPTKETVVFAADGDALEPEFWKVMGISWPMRGGCDSWPIRTPLPRPK